MLVLKKILQYKYLFFLLPIISLISYYQINLDYKSFYKGSETEFILTICDKKYKNNQYTIIFKENEKMVSYINNFPYNVGDIVYVKGSLIKPKNNTIPNNYNYKMYLQSRGIFWELKIDKIDIIEKNNSIIYAIKKHITDKIDNSKYREYLYAFILGDTSFFPNETRKIYQSCGLSFLLSIGSLQVMMIVKLLKFIEGKIKIKQKNSLIINIIVVILYVFLINRIVGVLRSGLCYVISNILKYYKIKYKYQNIIVFVGIILLIINPYYVINIGFLYSFTISIFISINNKYIKGHYFKRLFIISLISFVSSLPITLYCNYEINFLSVIYSLLFVPIFNYIIFPLSFITFLFSFLSPLYVFLISLLEYLINSLSNITIMNFVFRKPSMIIVILYYLIIQIFLYKKKYIIFLILMLFVHYNINKIISEEIVSFLDVGEGDAIVKKSNNNLILLDTGGNIYYKYYDNIINYIKSLGMNKINYLILSHGDYDHMGEAIDLVNNFKVEKVIFDCGKINELEEELIKELDKKKISYYSCLKELNIDNNKLYFLQTKEYDNENDNSNVIYTEINGNKFLFMGDAGKIREQDILNKYNISNIDVLKIGHHGSKSSSGATFVNKLSPKYSIISVGKNNRYGHPNKEVLENLNNSKIYRTDLDGSIIFKIKNNKLKIETCSP